MHQKDIKCHLPAIACNAPPKSPPEITPKNEAAVAIPAVPVIPSFIEVDLSLDKFGFVIGIFLTICDLSRIFTWFGEILRCWDENDFGVNATEDDMIAKSPKTIHLVIVDKIYFSDFDIRQIKTNYYSIQTNQKSSNLNSFRKRNLKLRMNYLILSDTYVCGLF